MKTLAIFDIDGTITDFYKIDRDIILKMYGKNKIISVLDNILWKINSLDIVTNRFLVFKIRMLFYSLVNGTSYKEDMEIYKSEYVYKAKKYFDDFMKKEYISLKENSLSVRLLTCDPFDGFFDEGVTIVQSKRRYVLDNVYGKYDKVYIIGNNYMDDIKVGLNLRSKMNDETKVSIFYIGNSKLLKKLIKNKKVNICSSLSEVIEKICR